MDIMQAIRTLRRSKADTVPVVIPDEWGIVVPYSEHRIVLILGTAFPNVVTFSANPNLQDAIAQGFGSPVNDEAIYLNIFQHAGLVLGPIYGKSQGGASNGSYTEVLLPLP